MSSLRVDERTLDFEYEVSSGRWVWSAGLRALHGLSAEESPTTDVLLDRMVEEHRDEMVQRFEKHLVTPGPYTCTYDMRDAHGHLRRLRYVGLAESDNGRVTHLSGFVIDITDMLREHAAEAVAAAVEHRAAIEQAKGALMLTFSIDDAAAFDLLRMYSSRSNTKLASVAERIVHAMADPALSSNDPARHLLKILSAFNPTSSPAEARSTIDA